MTCLVSAEVNFLPVEHFFWQGLVHQFRELIAKLESQFIRLWYHYPVKCINWKMTSFQPF